MNPTIHQEQDNFYPDTVQARLEEIKHLAEQAGVASIREWMTTVQQMEVAGRAVTAVYQTEIRGLLEQNARLREALMPFVEFVAMVEAHQQVAELPPLEDSDSVATFMGSGASARISIGDFRRAAKEVQDG